MWSPNGKLLAFTRFGVDSQGQLTSSSMRIFDPATRRARIIAAARMGLTDPLWSPNGGSVAFARNGITFGPNSGCYSQKLRDVAILTSDVRTGRVRRLVGVATLQLPRRSRPAFLYPLDWTLSGSRLLYMEERYSADDCRGNDLTAQIVSSVRSNGTGRRQLARATESASWSPSGRRVALVGGCDLFVMDASGRNRRRLVRETGPRGGCQFGEFLSFAWLSENELVFGDGRDVHAVDVATARRRKLATGSPAPCDRYCTNSILAVSRDKRFVAVAEYADDKSLLYVVAADGSRRWSLPYPKFESFSILLRSAV